MYKSIRKLTLCLMANQIFNTNGTRSVPTISQPYLSTRISTKKKTKLLTLIIAYFAAEGIWNNNIIIAFVNKNKSSTMECRDIEEQFVTECDPHNLNQFSQ